MTTLDDLYTYYCRRCDCKPNTRFSADMRAAFDAASGSRKLFEIDVSTNYLGPRGIEPVLELARNVYSLRRLSLRSNMLEHDDVLKVMRAVCRHPNIQEVDLGFNKIHDSSTANLLHLLRTNQNILRLGLDGCDFTAESRRAIDDQLRANRSLWATRCAEANVDADSETPAAVAQQQPSYTPYRCETAGVVTRETSGGHFHYASWRKNPQFAVHVTKDAFATITLRVADPQATRPVGFAVVRGRTALKVVEVRAEDILAESAFDEAVAKVQVHLTASDKARNSAPHVIIPFTFSPGKPADFTIAAEIAPELDAVITVEPLESRFDWVLNEVSGEWTSDSSGGSLAHSTWRENDGFRIRYEGGVSRGIATLFIVLSKANDSDDNDERAIGFYLLRPDFRGRHPVRVGPDTVAHAAEHRRETSVTLTLDVPCGSLDFLLMPTTALPGQLGEYTLSVYSTAPLAVERSIAPHGWALQVADGEWDSHRNGGSRRENPTTWIHCPCFELTVSGAADIDAVIALERAPQPQPQVGGAAGAADASAATTDASGEAGAAAAVIRPRPPTEIGVLLTRVDAELSTVGASPWCQRREAVLSVNALPPGAYYVIPLTRRPGIHDTFRLRTFTSAAVHMSLEVPLAARLREKQLQRYAAENDARRRAASGAEDNPGMTASHATSAVATESQRLIDEARALQRFSTDDTAAAAAALDSAVKQYLRDGTQFVDRDFPRGASSLWKDPAVAPPGAPAVHTWKRPSEIFPDRALTFAPALATLGADLDANDFGNEWFHSALALVSTRPEALAKVVGSYHPEYGVAQFRFHKAGMWRTVTIDDFLPVDAVGGLCFAQSLDPSDLFVPLAEKAWAKLHRCYEATRAPPQAIAEALMDVTGGQCSSHILCGAEGRDWAQRHLWKTLQRCREASGLLGLELPREVPCADEKKHAGLHLGRLYPVLDARLVEGNRLVKLRDFWGRGGCGAWRGKWAAGSARWSPTVRKAVDYVDEPSTFWVSFEEALHYFGVLHRVELFTSEAWVEGGFSAGQRGGSLLDTTWTANPQFALNVHATEPTEVRVGIHQPDARMCLLRAADAEVTYAAALGFAFIRTDDATRRLMAITDTELPTTVRARAQRDQLASFVVEPGSSYIIMPFSDTPHRAAQFHLSVRGGAPVSLTPIASDTTVAVEGEWLGATAGGPRGGGSWRNNPQYLLYPSEDAQITIVLRQRNDLASTTAHIGFTVMRAHGLRRALHCADDDIVLEVKPANDHAVAGTARLLGMSARRGMPYLVVPSTSVFGVETGFTLEVVANKRVQLRPVDPAADWCTVVRQERFSFHGGTAGGSMRFSSWRSNPQFAVTFPTERAGSLLVVASNNNANDTSAIGLVMLRADNGWDGGRRRKIQVARPHDIVAEAAPTPGYCELPVNFQVRREPLILMPFTELPLTELDFTLSFYCSSDVRVEPVREWRQEAVEGRWEPGLTAGGAREANRSWINNPFFALTVTRPTRLVVVGLQYPAGPRKPAVRRVGKERVFLPPPIADAGSAVAREVCFGLDLVHSDAHHTPIESTRHTRDGEISMALTLPPCETTPYFIVPHTFEPEQEADFKLVVYADEPVQLLPHRKARRFF